MLNKQPKILQTTTENIPTQCNEDCVQISPKVEQNSEFSTQDSSHNQPKPVWKTAALCGFMFSALSILALLYQHVDQHRELYALSLNQHEHLGTVGAPSAPSIADTTSSVGSWNALKEEIVATQQHNTTLEQQIWLETLRETVAAADNHTSP